MTELTNERKIEIFDYNIDRMEKEIESLSFCIISLKGQRYILQSKMLQDMENSTPKHDGSWFNENALSTKNEQVKHG